MNQQLDAIPTIARSQKLVVIVGAGVSTEAGVPSGGEIRKAILASPDGDLVRRILGSAAENAGFFQTLDVYRDVVGEKIFRSFLRHQLKYSKHQSMLSISKSYELLAHLLHHKSLTAIVSLNFDELLDDAIELEARGPGNTGGLRRSASLSEFQAVLEEIEDETDQRCRLFKPHGTISRSMTIRVREASVRGFEEVKNKVLTNYLNGADVLTLGWRLADPDLLRILNNTSRPDNHPVFVVWGEREADQGSRLNHHRFQPVPRWAADFLDDLITYVEQEKAAQVSRRTSAGAPIAEEIQGEVGALRHSIRSNFFSGHPPPLQPTLERQLAVEIVMHALKARGQFEPAILFDCPRIAFLANLLRQSDVSHTVSAILSKLANPPDHTAVVRKGSNEFGEPVYWLHAYEKDKGPTNAILNSIGKAAFESLISKLLNWPGTGNADALRDGDLRSALIKSFSSLTRTFDVDLVGNARDEAVFASAKSIHSKDEFARETREVLRRIFSDEAAAVCISTSTGEWLLRPEFRDALRECNKPLDIIVDDLSHHKENPYIRVHELRVAEVMKAYPHARVRSLSRKVHNLTGVIDNDGRFLAALYFRRESKTPSVSPVYLDGEQDLATLENIWVAMTQRASKFVNSEQNT